MPTFSRPYNIGSTAELLQHLAALVSRPFHRITIERGAILVDAEFPPVSVSFDSVLSSAELLPLSTESPVRVLQQVWHTCRMVRCVPIRCYVGSSSAAAWLGVSATYPAFYGVPVYQLTGQDNVAPDEFFFLLAPNWYAPLGDTRRICHGRSGKTYDRRDQAEHHEIRKPSDQGS